MELVTQEIASALNVLSISQSSFRLLPEGEAKPLFEDLLSEFVNGEDRRWWWEAFSSIDYSVDFDDGKAFERITDIAPDPLALTWFVVEEDQLPIYPIYEARPVDIQKVIGECYAFEYYIVSKSKKWLLCENHHNRMIGVGKEIIERMKELGDRQG